MDRCIYAVNIINMKPRFFMAVRAFQYKIVSADFIYRYKLALVFELCARNVGKPFAAIGTIQLWHTLSAVILSVQFFLRSISDS